MGGISVFACLVKNNELNVAAIGKRGLFWIFASYLRSCCSASWRLFFLPSISLQKYLVWLNTPPARRLSKLLTSSVFYLRISFGWTVLKKMHARFTLCNPNDSCVCNHAGIEQGGESLWERTFTNLSRHRSVRKSDFVWLLEKRCVRPGHNMHGLKNLLAIKKCVLNTE